MGAGPWRTGPGRGHDGTMWTLITLLWRIMTRLMRRLGMGALLVPVSAMGMALAGVHVWTVALVLIALAVVLRKPREWVALPALPAVAVPAGKAVPPGGWRFVRMPPGRWAEWAYLGKQQAKMTRLGQYMPAKPSAPSYAGPVINIGVAKAVPGWWQGRLL